MQKYTPRTLYTATINGRPITKKNSNQVIQGRNGKPVVIPSPQFIKYQEEAIPQLPQLAEPISQPCNVAVEYHVPDLIRRDLVNLLAATCDILVAAGVLVDDNWRIVFSHDGSRVVLDRMEPRACIHITARDDIDATRWTKPKRKDMAPPFTAIEDAKAPPLAE